MEIFNEIESVMRMAVTEIHQFVEDSSEIFQQQLDVGVSGLVTIMDKIDTDILMDLNFHFDPELKKQYIARVRNIAEGVPFPTDIQRIILEYADIKTTFRKLVRVDLIE